MTNQEHNHLTAQEKIPLYIWIMIIWGSHQVNVQRGRFVEATMKSPSSHLPHICYNDTCSQTWREGCLLHPILLLPSLGVLSSSLLLSSEREIMRVWGEGAVQSNYKEANTTRKKNCTRASTIKIWTTSLFFFYLCFSLVILYLFMIDYELISLIRFFMLYKYKDTWFFPHIGKLTMSFVGIVYNAWVDIHLIS